MPRTVLPLAPLALLALLAGGAAAADDAPPPPPPPGMGPGGPDAARMAEHFNKMKDRNPDFFKRLDANGDGTISTDEAAAFLKQEQDRRQEREDKAFTEADKDKDGKLDRGEYAEAIRLMHRPMGMGKPPKDRGPGRPPGGPDGAGAPPAPKD